MQAGLRLCYSRTPEDRFSRVEALIINGPGRWIVTESLQPLVHCEMATKYSPRIFRNLMNILLIYAIIEIRHDFHIKFLVTLGTLCNGRQRL